MVRVVSGLWFSPVKSLHGIERKRLYIDHRGIANDRMWMVIDARTKLFLTQRQIPQMARVRQHLGGGESLMLSAPAGPYCFILSQGIAEKEQYNVGIGFQGRISWYPAVDEGDGVAEWLSQFLKRDVRLVRFPDNGVRYASRGIVQIAWHDGYPFLIASEAALEERNRRGSAVPMSRFRPNIVVAGTEPHEEDHWRRIRIGDVELEGMTLCGRCAVVNTDQETGARDTGDQRNLSVLQEYRQLATLLTSKAYSGYACIKERNKICFGRNFNHSGEGIIRLRDEVQVLERD